MQFIAHRWRHEINVQAIVDKAFISYKKLTLTLKLGSIKTALLVLIIGKIGKFGAYFLPDV